MNQFINDLSGNFKYDNIKTEYYPVDHHQQFGKGDLIIYSKNTINVIEFKYLDTNNSKNAKRRRTKMRQKLRDQAKTYAAFAKIYNKTKKVNGTAITNQGSNVIIRNISYATSLKWLIHKMNNGDQMMLQFKSYLKKCLYKII